MEITFAAQVLIACTIVCWIASGGVLGFPGNLKPSRNQELTAKVGIAFAILATLLFIFYYCLKWRLLIFIPQ